MAICHSPAPETSVFLLLFLQNLQRESTAIPHREIRGKTCRKMSGFGGCALVPVLWYRETSKCTLVPVLVQGNIRMYPRFCFGKAEHPPKPHFLETTLFPGHLRPVILKLVGRIFEISDSLVLRVRIWVVDARWQPP